MHRIGVPHSSEVSGAPDEDKWRKFFDPRSSSCHNQIKQMVLKKFLREYLVLISLKELTLIAGGGGSMLCSLLGLALI